MTILPQNTQRMIRNRGMAALYGIAAEHDCDVSDVLDLLVTTSFTSISGPDKPFVPVVVTTPSQPNPPPSAAQTDGAAEPPVPTVPSVDLSGLAAHEQGPIPSTDASQDRAQTATGLGAGGDNPDPTSRPTATAKTDVPSDRGQASGGGQSQDNSGVRAASVEPELPAPGNAPEPESRSTVSRQPGSGDFLPKAKKEPKPPRRVTNRQRVRECHEAHPDWTAQQVADETGLSKDNVWTIASQIKIKWPDRKASTTEALQRATARPEQPEAAPEVSEAQPTPEQPPVTTADDLNERLIALHTAEPTLTRPELARRLGTTVGKVNYRVERLSLDVPHARRTDDEPFTPEVIPAANPQKPVAPPPPRTGTLTDRVRALHEQHPTWTARMIANELGANVNSVSTLLAQVRGTPSAEPAQRQQFTGRMDMINHYSEVAKRLGKPA